MGWGAHRYGADERDLGCRSACQLDGGLQRLVSAVIWGRRCAYLSAPWPHLEEAGAEQAVTDLGHTRYPPSAGTLYRFAKSDIDGAGRRSGDGDELLDVTHCAPFRATKFLTQLGQIMVPAW
jgi:hypothetical protein